MFIIMKEFDSQVRIFSTMNNSSSLFVIACNCNPFNYKFSELILFRFEDPCIDKIFLQETINPNFKINVPEYMLYYIQRADATK